VRTENIDEDLPFSEDEFYRAFRLLESEAEAREAAAFVVQVVRKANEQAQRARLALTSGTHDGSSMGVPAWVIEDGAFALLALVSDDLRERVEAYMHARWEADREHLLRNRLYRGRGVFLREPTAEVYAEVEAQTAETAAEWHALVERVRGEVERHRE
jgi:hypothetical protein